MIKVNEMEQIYSFDLFIDKVNEGLIKTYDIEKTTEVISRILSNLNLNYSLKKLSNNSFEITLYDFNRINHLKESVEYILDTLFNLYGWFPSTLEVETLLGMTASFAFQKDYLLNPSNKIAKVKITFEAKFDKIETDIPPKLYHLTIQHYEKDILAHGLLPKGKSKLTSHDYDGRIYLCKSIDDCKILINRMKIFYEQERDSILYSGKNPKRQYTKITKWLILEIDTNSAGIKVLYKDPNYINGYYCLTNITPESISIIEKQN